MKSWLVKTDIRALPLLRLELEYFCLPWMLHGLLFTRQCWKESLSNARRVEVKQEKWNKPSPALHTYLLSDFSLSLLLLLLLLLFLQDFPALLPPFLQLIQLCCCLLLLLLQLLQLLALVFAPAAPLILQPLESLHTWLGLLGAPFDTRAPGKATNGKMMPWAFPFPEPWAFPFPEPGSPRCCLPSRFAPCKLLLATSVSIRSCQAGMLQGERLPSLPGRKESLPQAWELVPPLFYVLCHKGCTNPLFSKANIFYKPSKKRQASLGTEQFTWPGKQVEIREERESSSFNIVF